MRTNRFITTPLLILLSALSLLPPNRAPAQTNPTAPQAMPIGLAHPKPAKQTGLRRPQGDGNLWTFQILPETGITWVEGPTWSYPGKGGGADPAWGQWGGGDGSMWLSWISPEVASAFTIKVTGKILPTGGTGGGGEVAPIDIEASWEGEVTSFTMAVRRMNSNTAFGGSAKVAAGHIPNAGHQAEIEITAKDQAGNPTAGVEVPTVRILSGGLGPQSAVTATVSMNNATTDALGKATGTFTSGNRTQTTTLILDTDGDVGTTEGKPTVSISQVWNELGDDSWPPSFPDFEYDEPDAITYSMAYDDGDEVEIAGHSLEFLTTGIGGLEWNPNIGEDWTGWNENGEPDFIPDGEPDGDYEDKTYFEVDSNPAKFWTWQGLSTFTASSSNGGEYSSDQTIHFDWDFIVDKVWFDLYDNNVYAESGETS